MLACACIEPPPLTQRSLDVVLRGLGPAAASVQLVVGGPEQRTLERAVDGAVRRTLRVELLRPGSDTVRAQTLFSAGRALHDAERREVHTEPGLRTTLELELQVLPADAGAGDADDDDRGLVALADAAAAVDRAAADSTSSDVGTAPDAAGEDAARAAPQPTGLLAPGFPVVWDGPDAYTDVGRAVAVVGDAVWVTGASTRLDTTTGRARVAAVAGHGRALGHRGARLCARRRLPRRRHRRARRGRRCTLWAAGHLRESLFATDLALWRFTPHGQLVAGFYVVTRAIEGPSNRNGGADALALDAEGDLWAAGPLSSRDADTDMALLRYDASGLLRPGPSRRARRRRWRRRLRWSQT